MVKMLTKQTVYSDLSVLDFVRYNRISCLDIRLQITIPRQTIVAGTSKSGRVFRYYRCSHCFTCTNKENLELLVHHALCQVICTEEKRKFLANKCYEIYTANNKQHDKNLVLTKELAQTEKAIANLIKALEAGIFSDTTKARLDEPEYRKTLLELQLQTLTCKIKTPLPKRRFYNT